MPGVAKHRGCGPQGGEFGSCGGGERPCLIGGEAFPVERGLHRGANRGAQPSQWNVVGQCGHGGAIVVA